MIKIAYAKLGFWNGLLIGLLASLSNLALISLLGLLTQGGASHYGLDRLGDFVDHYSFFFLIAWLLLFTGLPVALLLWHRRILCLLGMLLMVVPAGIYAWLMLYGIALAGVKCLGSCG